MAARALQVEQKVAEMSRAISQLNGSIVMEMSDLHKERFQIMAQFLQEVRAVAAAGVASENSGDSGETPGGRDASLLHPPLSQTDRAGTVQLEKCQRRFHGAAATALEGAVADADRCVPAAAWVGRGAGWGQPERLRPGFADVLLPPLPHTHTSSTARRL